MKKLILTAIAILTITFSFSQTNFQWEKIDSVAKTKAQIYSDTKMFISETWKSAQNVIQNDDKDAGMILVKGASIQTAYYGKGMMGQTYKYIYHYTVKFYMKDGKYKMILDEVKLDKAYMVGSTYTITPIEPFDGDNCPETGTIKHMGCPKKSVIIMMAEFKAELQNIVDSYEKYIKTTSASNTGW